MNVPPGDSQAPDAPRPDDGAYRPIDCDLHDRFELAAMHREELVLEWREDDGAEHVAHVRIEDVVTRENGEYLRGQLRSGSALEVRLDRILRHAPP
jgi:Rho-binding antiterminator